MSETQEEALLSHFLTDGATSVYALRNLPEEVVAVLFAYYSRSKIGLRENLLRLLKDRSLGMQLGDTQNSGSDLTLAEEKAKAFHEKWVIGYGHASVAEHAVVHLALEDISIIASKFVEDNRLASYTEKSTRYVQFEQDHFHMPTELIGSKHEDTYREACRHLFETYTELIEPLTQAIMTAFPPKEGQRPRAVERACRARALDALRAMLPASTKTNVGLTLNGRAAAHMISKLRSSEVAECRELGKQIQGHAAQVLPSLLKYADERAYYKVTPEKIRGLAEQLLPEVAHPPVDDTHAVSILRVDDDLDQWVVAAILFRHSHLSLGEVYDLVGAMPMETWVQVVDTYLEGRGPHDAPLRELEHVASTCEIMLDYGAYRDIQRHRLATQTPQALSTCHGYVMPEEFEIFKMEGPFKRAMAVAESAYEEICQDFPHVAPYVVPLAYRFRVAFTWNFRELFHFIELRSAPQGHRSYRRVAQTLFSQLEERAPLLCSYIRVTMGDADLGRLQAEERAEAKREALKARGIQSDA